jgi:hypothetical protein
MGGIHPHPAATPMKVLGIETPGHANRGLQQAPDFPRATCPTSSSCLDALGLRHAFASSAQGGGYPLGKLEVAQKGSIAVFAHFGRCAMEDVGKVGSGGAPIGIENSFGHRHILYADS